MKKIIRGFFEVLAMVLAFGGLFCLIGSIGAIDVEIVTLKQGVINMGFSIIAMVSGVMLVKLDI